MLTAISNKILDLSIIHLDWNIDLDDTFRVEDFREFGIILALEELVGSTHLRLSREEWIIIHNNFGYL